jgi:hypothetical protein
MTQNGQFVKLGLRTSLTNRDMVDAHPELRHAEHNLAPAFAKNDAPRPSHPPPGNILIKPALSADELNETKYFNSLGVRNGRAEFAYHQTVNNSNFVPPPPSRFLVSSGHHSFSGPQPSQLPIQSGHPQVLLPPGQVPLFQSVHKTYIPHHIYNEIPILNSETKYYQEQQAEEVMEEDVNGADVRMLEEYDKLYQKYQEERENSVSLLRKIEFLEGELSKNDRDPEDPNSRPSYAEPIIREVVKTKEVYVAKPTRVDTRQLVAILMKKVKPVMDDTFDRRKASCINKLKALLSDQEIVIKTAVLRSTEELIRH